MKLFSGIAHQIYDHIVGRHLPWGYKQMNGDKIEKTIDVVKIHDGLRVIVTADALEYTGYREMFIDIPQAEIDRLLNQ